MKGSCDGESMEQKLAAWEIVQFKLVEAQNGGFVLWVPGVDDSGAKSLQQKVTKQGCRVSSVQVFAPSTGE